jgi:BRCA1-associated protein
MPAYFFHVAFELHPSRSLLKPSYTPPPQTNIFTSELPAHNSTSWTSLAPPRCGYDKLSKSVASSSDASHLAKSSERPLDARERPPSSRRYSHRSRPSFAEHHDSPVPLVKLPARPAHKRTQSFATRDWRFDTISIVSIDMKPSDGEDRARPHAKSLKHRATQSGGLATKGKFIPSELKDTEVGWGVVHLYRDGHETPDLHDNSASTEFKEDDCTTLCILAVPSYMTPSDLLGFMGEQTREDVSHFRLIRTARANKYMVLMKFREASKARGWRKEWNGKAFNSMEVSIIFSRHGLARLTVGSQSTATSFS